MAAEVARAYCLQWSHSPLPARGPCSSRFLTSSFPGGCDRAIAFLGTSLLQHSHHGGRSGGGRRRASPRASLDGFVDDEGEVGFEKRKKEFATEFMVEAESRLNQEAGISNSNHIDFASACPVSCKIYSPFPSLSPEILAMPPDPWPNCDALSPERLGQRANSFDLPLSLRILKRKKKRRETAVMDEYACCSVRKAFSSMVFIVQALQRHAIRMREVIFSSSDLQSQGILARIHDELPASFVWLFQHIFSATPTLMVYLMLLLANFTVFSITDFPADAAPTSHSISVAVGESGNPTLLFDYAAVKTFSIGESTATEDTCGGGGGGKSQEVTSAAHDGEWGRSLCSFPNSETISPEALSTASPLEEEAWKVILQESELLRANDRHEALLDPDTLKRFVSPVTAVLEKEDLSAYSLTELSYRRALADDPNDPLILSNFAQFLYLVLRDHDSAEEYFKRAGRAEPADAEALCRYANFLWAAKDDVGAAEEMFLEAIAADPGNSHYSANYAHFLWSTGGVDTCYPLDAGDP